jgi:hypothetical protein
MTGANRAISWPILALLASAALAGCSSTPRPSPASMGGIAAVSAEGQPTIPRDEVDAHREGPDPFIFVRDSAADSLFESISLTVAVDAQGQVTEAKVIGGKTTYYAAAEAAVRRTRYKPFTREGKAVPAVFVDYVQVLPRERPATRSAPMPAADPATAQVTMARSACYGTCPVYQVTLEGSGRVTWQGQSHVAIPGAVTYQIPPQDVAGLVALFGQASFFSLDDSYRAQITDGPTTTLTLSLGGKTKSVKDYIGYAVGMPMSVEQLEKAIDKTAMTQLWIKGTPETIPALKRAGWRFESPAAAGMLACGIQRMPERLIADLLAAGVGPNGACDGISSLALAAEASRRDTVKALIIAGADVHVKDPGGRTIAQIAQEQKWRDVSELVAKQR